MTSIALAVAGPALPVAAGAVAAPPVSAGLPSTAIGGAASTVLAPSTGGNPTGKCTPAAGHEVSGGPGKAGGGLLAVLPTVLGAIASECPPSKAVGTHT